MDANQTEIEQNTPDAAAPQEENTLRDDLAAALEQETQESAPDTDPAGTDPGESGPARDDSGRFAKQEKQKEGQEPGHGASDSKAQGKAAGANTPPGGPTPAAQPVPEKAPASWKPAAREVWAQLPAEARAEVVRREREVAQVLQESAEARKGYESFRQTIAPYEVAIRAEGSDPLRAITSLMNTAMALRTAPPAQKAGLVAQIITQYGVDLQSLDQYLAAALQGRPVPQQGAQQPAYQDPRVDKLLADLEAAKAARAEASLREAQSEIEQFTQEHEFMDDLRQDMADILELAQRRGQSMSLKEAHDRAVALNPEIGKILTQRQAAQRARTGNPATQRARTAASSVRSTHAVPPRIAREDTSLREDLEAALEEAAR